MAPHRTAPSPTARRVVWIGSSRHDLIALPVRVRTDIGKQLRKVQFGEPPDDFSPMTTVGQGAYEIRERDADGWYRAIYVAKFEKAVYVLHAFRKKTNATAQRDIDLAKARYIEAKRDSEQ